jgi:hypothetical protein
MGVFACILGIGNDFLSLLYRMVCGGLLFREVVIICAEPTALLVLVFSFVADGLKSAPIDTSQAYGFLKLSTL